ncbi:hypothetical protein LCGC14_2757890, partial [marine sediment metagenome]
LEYATVVELEEYLLGASKTQPAQAGNFAIALSAASRNIDKHCGRRFWIDDAATERIFTVENGYSFPVPDIATTTGLVVATDEDRDGVYETAWTLGARTGAGYEVAPYNAQTDPELKEPYTSLEANASVFPTYRMAISVTAKWGWPAVPDDIKQATLLHAARFWKRKDAVLGLGGNAELGFFEMRRKIDPDVAKMIDVYRNFA